MGYYFAGERHGIDSSDGASQDEMTQIDDVADPESCEFETQFQDRVVTRTAVDDEVTAKTTRAVVSDRETQRDKFFTSENINL